MDNSLFSSSGVERKMKFGKSQSREEFFCTKRKLKRMKTSICLSQTIQRTNTPPSFDCFSVVGDSKDDIYNEELESTFGFQEPLTFKDKTHRRKYFKKITLQPDQDGHLQGDTGDTETTALSLDSIFDCKVLHEEEVENENVPQRDHGLTLEDFIVFEKLGEGTYSEVFRALESKTGFLCALKILNKQRLREENLLQNLLHQIKICSFIDHPNISKLYGFFHDQNFIYLVTEYATEKTLYHEIINKPAIKLKRGMMSDKVVNIVGQLTSAVRFLHNHCVIHRDIKPENVLMTMFDTVKLCDFGWATYSPNKEMRSTICGTLLYMAPEVINMDDYGDSVDVWAIGVLTYELMTDENPFKITKMSDISKIVKEQVSFGGLRNKKAVEFMGKALEKDPERRNNIYELSSDPFLENFRQDYIFEL